MASLSSAIQFLQQLTCTAGRIRTGLASLMDEFGLTEQRFEALRELARRGDEGCSQTELAATLGCAESSVCGLVDKLQDEGWLHRFRSRRDRRRSLLLLTRTGAERLTAAEQAADTAVQTWLQQISDDELLDMVRWLQRFADQIPSDPANAAPPANLAARVVPPATDAAPTVSRWKEAG